MLVARLSREHAKLRALGASLVVLITNIEPCDLDELARQRWKLARLVHQHLAYEERQLFQRLEADPRPEARAACAQSRRGIDQLHSLYTEHVERWTAAEVFARWPEFQTAVKTMVTRMTLKLDHEEYSLFPFVAGEEELEHRWRPGRRNWAGDGVAMQPLISRAASPQKQDN